MFVYSFIYCCCSCYIFVFFYLDLAQSALSPDHRSSLLIHSLFTAKFSFGYFFGGTFSSYFLSFFLQLFPMFKLLSSKRFVVHRCFVIHDSDNTFYLIFHHSSCNIIPKKFLHFPLIHSILFCFVLFSFFSIEYRLNTLTFSRENQQKEKSTIIIISKSLIHAQCEYSHTKKKLSNQFNEIIHFGFESLSPSTVGT